MKENCLVSIIVPVYNVSLYLEDCISSILEQSYKNIEIILVDDGSTDGSGKICDKYKEQDSRIFVIHKENGGLSDARNLGLDASHGDYIAFVDSDDFISSIFIEIFVGVAVNGKCDIVALDWGTSFWDGEDYPMLETDPQKCFVEYMNAEKVLEYMLYQKIATGAPFKMYSREVFKELRFPRGWYYEDVATTYKTFLKAQKAAIISGKLYAYRMRKDSIIRQKFSKKKLSAIRIFEQLYDDDDLENIGLHKAAVSRGYAMLFSVFLQIPYKKQDLRKRVWIELKRGQKTVMFDKNKLMRKKNKYAAWVSVLGMNVTYIIGKKYGQKGSMN